MRAQAIAETDADVWLGHPTILGGSERLPTTMMKALEYVPVPFYEDNYAWVLTDGQHAIVVDPGAAEPIVEYLTDRQLVVTAILLTHHHADHVGGVQTLLRACGRPDASVFGPARSALRV